MCKQQFDVLLAVQGLFNAMIQGMSTDCCVPPPEGTQLFLATVGSFKPAFPCVSDHVSAPPAATCPCCETALNRADTVSPRYPPLCYVLFMSTSARARSRGSCPPPGLRRHGGGCQLSWPESDCLTRLLAPLGLHTFYGVVITTRLPAGVLPGPAFCSSSSNRASATVTEPSDAPLVQNYQHARRAAQESHLGPQPGSAPLLAAGRPSCLLNNRHRRRHSDLLRRHCGCGCPTRPTVLLARGKPASIARLRCSR